MKILVINAGSSSLKYQLIDMNGEILLAKGNCEMIGDEANSFLTHTNVVKGTKTPKKVAMPNHSVALRQVLACLTDGEIGVLSSVSEIGAVGHRVLHGGELFAASSIVNDETMAMMESLKPLGPLHMPANLGCIKDCQEVMKGVPMVAVFDTVFHATIPPKAFLYAIPYSDYTNYKIRKYGFHGTSHKFVCGEANKYLSKPNAKVIICHLGNGASLSATYNGVCMDTSMGYTPLEGLVMGTRSGDIDPAACVAIAEHHNFTSFSQLDTYLNKKSGMLGIAGENDSRKLQALAADGDNMARLALDMFEYRVKKYIGSYVAALGGVDAVAFTGGIGENSASARANILSGLECMGLKLDSAVNEGVHGDFAEINTPDSAAKILVIPTNEELVIARDTLEIVSAL